MEELKRDTYKPERYGGISLHNEPPDDLFMTTNVRLYPDMYYVYKKFADWLGLPAKNIMLGNGAENVIKNVLLALKPKSISWSVPTWGFIDVYCAQLNCQPIKHNFKYEDSLNICTEEDFTEDIDVYYNTLWFNSILKHEQSWRNLHNSRVSIIDLTYCELDEICKIARYFNEYRLDQPANIKPNIIYVGSFDKMFGAGLRLGFAFFSNAHVDSMALQRENYINQLAADFILKHEFEEPEKKYYNLLKQAYAECKIDRRSMLCKSFITVPFKADYTQLQHREIQLNGQWWSKFGIPHDEEEWFQLQMTLGITK